MRITGVGWLVAALVGIVVAVVVFGNGVSGAAIPVTVVDNTVVRWMSEIDGPASRGLPGV